ncbi:pilus assembly protein PilM [Bdellovibrionota bacterium FG-2]
MRILGLDLGHSSIKAVELESTFGRFEIRDYYEQAITPGEDAAQALARLMGTLPKAPDRLIMGLQGGKVTFRNLQLPTRDKKAIQATIGFELEDEIPFPMEQAAFEYSILPSTTRGATTVHVALTLKKHINALLESCTGTGADPDILTTESWAFRTLLNRILGPVASGAQEQPVMVVHIGHERTLIYVHWRGTPILTREIPWGGSDLSVAICQKYQIPMEEAQQSILDHGFVIPSSQKGEATAEQIEFSQTLMQPFLALISELRQAKLTCKNLSRQNVGLLYTSGGTSLLPGLSRIFEEYLQITTKPLRALSSVSTSGVTYSESSDASFSLAAALALCHVGSDKAVCLNFRRGEFSKSSQTHDMNLANLKKPALALGAILGTFLISLFIESAVHKDRLQEVDVQLEKNVRSFFGQISGSAIRTYLTSTDSLRGAINKELTKQREMGKLLSPNPRSPLEFLKTLSETTPKDTIVDLTRFQVGAAPSAPYATTDDAAVLLTFLVANPQIAEKLNTQLGKQITGLTSEKVEEVPPTGENETKRWKISFKGKPSGAAYGK